MLVYRKPQVAILATGDEIVDIDVPPAAHQIRNSNTYSLAAQVQAATGTDPTLNRYTKLPANFPADVRAKAAQITAGDTTPWAKAVALQNFADNQTQTHPVGMQEIASSLSRSGNQNDDAPFFDGAKFSIKWLLGAGVGDIGWR